MIKLFRERERTRERERDGERDRERNKKKQKKKHPDIAKRNNKDKIIESET